MKAIIYHKYGPPDVLRLEEVEKPVPGDEELLVRVHAASVNPSDWHAMTGLWITRIGSGLRHPDNPRLGTDFAGVVEAVGKNVTRFRPGDEVFGGRKGALAEYVCVREDRGVALKPANVTFAGAAAVPTAAITALQGLRDHGQVRPGHRVLINGASGGVGTFAIQIAKRLGAHVSGVTSSGNVERIRALGADQVFDYTRQDFTRSDQRFDLLLDIAGSRSWRDVRRILKPDATLVIIGGPKSNRLIGPLGHVIQMRLGSLRASQKVIFFIANFNRQDFELLKGYLETDLKPVVQAAYPFGETAEAIRLLGTGHAWGKIVVTVQGSS